MPERYCPANGSEALCFESEWCDLCERERTWRESDGDTGGCAIIAKMYASTYNDPDYPPELIYDENEVPKCTAFVPEGEEIKERCPETPDMFT